MSDGTLPAALTALIERINNSLRQVLEEDECFFGEIGIYSLIGGGKRLRPMIFCLSSGALGSEIDDEVVKLSLTFELLHMATLMHDDIVDQSDTRRGRPAVHHIFGVPETVLAADYLLAKAGLMSLSKKNLEAVILVIELIRELSLGELAELKASHRVDLQTSEYFDIIYRKTAVLLETVGNTAACLVGAGPNESRALSEYGRRMGLAFQIIDDIFDYRSKAGTLGKPVGQDLAEGRITLPFILARDNLAGFDRQRLLELGAILNPSEEVRLEARSLVEKGSGSDLSMAEAQRQAKQAAGALEVLPPTAERDLLVELAYYTVKRDR
ncbi:MAG: polyprenyl synthetase family protein [Deltaproteobacteria bacterium]|jgi:octaprenyl-diphosphate synthase|nr:polyprenyl synthetase family protein [Deltaproteobacteria bacterium]